MTTNRLQLRSRLLSRSQLWVTVLSVAIALAVFGLARQSGWWPVAVAVVLAMELWPVRWAAKGSRGKAFLARVPQILMGTSVVLIIAVAPRIATQVVVAGLYAWWRAWWTTRPDDTPTSLAHLLVVLTAVYEALFLIAAPPWRTSEWVILALVWVCSYLAVYAGLSRRGDRAAGVMAAVWALVAAEISWVLLLWLFVYTLSGGYLLVPQPVLVLTALAYCFGSIYLSQRAGKLSRGRLTEYLLIGLILITIVITGTPWKGTL